MEEEEVLNSREVSHKTEYLPYRNSFDVPTKNMQSLSKNESRHKEHQNEENNDEIGALYLKLYFSFISAYFTKMKFY